MNLSENYGLIRSWLMYYAKPFNGYRLISFYKQFIQPGDLAFDIGAHLGNRTQAWLSLQAKVIAVEPQPVCIKFLEKKFSTNPDFKLLKVMLGPQPGSAPFSISTKSPTISTARGEDWRAQINGYSRKPALWDLHIEVPMITLDQMILSYGIPKFCKIDTEGFEWEVICGLNTPIAHLSLEYLAFDRKRLIDCVLKIQSLGDYICNFSPGESQQWYWSTWKSAQETINILEQEELPFVFGDLYLSKI